MQTASDHAQSEICPTVAADVSPRLMFGQAGPVPSPGASINPFIHKYNHPLPKPVKVSITQ